MIFNPRWFDNSRPDGIAVLEITEAGRSGPAFVPLQKTLLEGSVSGPLADFTITQVFRYTRESNPRVIEALYRFPLPGDAVVIGIDVSFGDVTIRSELRPRKDAVTDYENAKKENRSAALVTRESPDVFTLRIAGIAPDEDVRVRTRYVQIGSPEGTGFLFRIPLTTAPRYVRSDEQYSRHANGQPFAVLRDPGHQFRLSVNQGTEGTLKCLTHAIVTTPGGVVVLAGGETIPDRDCVLVWEPVRDDVRPSCRVFSDGCEETHFLALVSPPCISPVRYPRDVIILVDHSGSMEGVKWEAADWAVERFISGLSGGDTFNLGLFESATSWFSRGPVPASPANKSLAIQFLQNKKSGGTELGVALEQALSQIRKPGIVSRHVIIITDAEVTDSARILHTIDAEARQTDARRCSILCIDSAPNSTLARQVAERGGGIAKFLSSSPQEEDITSALDAILALWDAPVAVGLTLAVNRDNLLVDQRKVSRGPDGRCHIDLGDLPAGSSTWVVVRSPPGTAPLRAELCGPEKTTFPAPVQRCPAVSALFGARLTAELEYLMHADYPENEVMRHLAGLGYDTNANDSRSQPKIYAENRMQDTMNLIKDLIVRESLRYSLLTAETAFIAVRSEPGRAVEEQVIVPNALPHGWSESFTTFAPMPKMSSRRCSNQPSGGACLAWDAGGSGGRSDMILQPDGTMKMEARRVKSPASASGNLIPAANDPSVSTVTVSHSSQPAPGGYRLFSGIPAFENNEAVLYDSSRAEDAPCLPERIILKRLEITVRGSLPETGLYLLIYLEDPIVPGVKVLLGDLLRHRGSRPLNIRRTQGELLKIVLAGPEGIMKKKCPVIEVVVK